MLLAEKTVAVGGFSGKSLQRLAEALVDQAKEQNQSKEFIQIFCLAILRLTGEDRD